MARTLTKKLSKLTVVEKEVIACELCPRLRDWCEEVARVKRRAFRDETYWGKPVPGFGDPKARLLVVGLAPAAHGGNRTGRVFTGDSSGDWLYEALHRYGFASKPQSVRPGDGLELIECWITASARCAPPDNKPTREELDHCQPYLEAEIALLPEIEVVIALGHVAHERWLRASGAWARLSARERPKFAHLAEWKVGDVTLIDSYHPSRQNTQTGKLTRDMWHAVFKRARQMLDWILLPKREKRTNAQR